MNKSLILSLTSASSLHFSNHDGTYLLFSFNQDTSTLYEGKHSYSSIPQNQTTKFLCQYYISVFTISGQNSTHALIIGRALRLQYVHMCYYIRVYNEAVLLYCQGYSSDEIILNYSYYTAHGKLVPVGIPLRSQLHGIAQYKIKALRHRQISVNLPQWTPGIKMLSVLRSPPTSVFCYVLQVCLTSLILLLHDMSDTAVSAHGRSNERPCTHRHHG